MHRSSILCCLFQAYIAVWNQTAILRHTYEDCSEETYLILVKYLAVMEVGMRKYPIDAATDRAQLGHWRLLDAHPSNATLMCAMITQECSCMLDSFAISQLNWFYKAWKIKLGNQPAREVFVAIEKAGSSIQRVPGVINSRALLTKQQNTQVNSIFCCINLAMAENGELCHSRSDWPL